MIWWIEFWDVVVGLLNQQHRRRSWMKESSQQWLWMLCISQRTVILPAWWGQWRGCPIFLFCTKLKCIKECAQPKWVLSKERLPLQQRLWTTPKSQLFQLNVLIILSLKINLVFADSVIQESEAGNPCHSGTEETAPIGSYTCDHNVSICLGKRGDMSFFRYGCLITWNLFACIC